MFLGEANTHPPVLCACAGSVGQPPPGSALHASFSVFAETYRQLSQQLLSVVATTARGMDPAAAAAAAAAAGAPAVGGGLQMPGTQHLPAWQRHAMLQNSLALLMNPAGPGAAVMGPPGAAPGAAPSHRRRSGGGMTYSTSSSVTSSSTSSSGALAREAAYAAPHAAAQGAQGEAEQQGAPVAHAPQLELAGLPATSQQQQQQQPMDLDMPAAPALLVATSGEPEHGAGSLPGQPATPTAAAAAAAEAAAANLLQQQAMAALAAAATTAHIQQQEAERWAASLLMHSPLAAASMANSWAAPLSVRSEEELIAAHAALQKRLEVCERVMSICGVPMEAPPPSPTAAAAAAAAGWHQGAGGGFAAPQHQHQHQHAHVQQGSHGHAPHQTHSHGHHQQQLQMGWASDAQPASPSFTASDSSAPLAFMNTPGNAGSSQAYPMGSNVDQLLHVQRQQVQAQLWRAHMHQQQQQQQGQAYAVAAAAAAAAGFQLPPGGLAAMQQQMQRGAWSAQGSQRDHHSAGHPTELYAASTRSGMSW